MKKVCIYDLENGGKLLDIFKSEAEAARYFGVSRNFVHMSLHNKQRVKRIHGRYLPSLKYLGDRVNPKKHSRRLKKASVVEVTKDLKFVALFDSITEASKATKCSLTGISKVVRSQINATNDRYFWYADKYLQHLKDNFEPIPKELDEDGFLDEEVKEKLDFF